MTTNLPNDDLLTEEASNAGDVRSAGDGRIDESDQPHEQPRIIDLFGTVEFQPDYDYKDQRNLARSIDASS